MFEFLLPLPIGPAPDWAFEGLLELRDVCRSRALAGDSCWLPGLVVRLFVCLSSCNKFLVEGAIAGFIALDEEACLVLLTSSGLIAPFFDSIIRLERRGR